LRTHSAAVVNLAYHEVETEVAVAQGVGVQQASPRMVHLIRKQDNLHQQGNREVRLNKETSVLMMARSHRAKRSG